MRASYPNAKWHDHGFLDFGREMVFSNGVDTVVLPMSLVKAIQDRSTDG